MIRRVLRRCAVVAAALGGFAVAFANPALADAVGGGANNIVLVSTTAGHLVDQRSSVQAATFSGPYVNNTNIASAQATNCTGCRSVAVAFQAVLVGGADEVFTPGDAATASNGGCTDCTSFAFAFQYLVSTPGPAHLTPAGQAAVAVIRDQVAQVTYSGADVATLCTELTALASEFEQAINASGNVATGGQPLTGFPYLDTGGSCPNA